MKIYEKQITIGDSRFSITIEVNRVIAGNHVIMVNGIGNDYFMSYSADTESLERRINQSIEETQKWVDGEESQNKIPEVIFLESRGFKFCKEIS